MVHLVLTTFRHGIDVSVVKMLIAKWAIVNTYVHYCLVCEGQQRDNVMATTGHLHWLMKVIVRYSCDKNSYHMKLVRYK